MTAWTHPRAEFCHGFSREPRPQAPNLYPEFSVLYRVRGLVMRAMHLREGLGSPAQAPLPAQQSFAGRVHRGLQRTWQKSLPALLPGIHQISAKTAFNRYPQIFAGAAHAAPNARRILSFGCSTGEECATLKMYFPQAKVVGADLNPVSL
jgi:hypothetical protein